MSCYHREGGPAYPVTLKTLNRGLVTECAGYAGMSLRDYFAAHAVTGIVIGPVPPTEAAKLAYAVADAMLAERRKGGEA